MPENLTPEEVKKIWKDALYFSKTSFIEENDLYHRQVMRLCVECAEGNLKYMNATCVLRIGGANAKEWQSLYDQMKEE